jgi:hypothetical protein
MGASRVSAQHTDQGMVEVWFGRADAGKCPVSDQLPFLVVQPLSNSSNTAASARLHLQ